MWNNYFRKIAIISCLLLSSCNSGSQNVLLDPENGNKRSFISQKSTMNSSVEAGDFAANWQSFLGDYQRLAEISIPGTHDSGAQMPNFSIASGNKAYMVIREKAATQYLSIEEQLNIGVRVLDVRVRNLGSNLNIVHGSAEFADTFDNVVASINQFLNKHPQEFILMRLRYEKDKITDSEESNFYRLFAQTHTKYDNLFVKSIDDPRDVLIKELRGKILILNDNVPTDVGTRYNNFYISDEFKYGVEDKLKLLNKEFKDNYSHNRITYTSIVGIPGIFGLPTQKEAAKVINPEMKELFKKKTVVQTGIVMMDFIDEGLANLIFSKNFANNKDNFIVNIINKSSNLDRITFSLPYCNALNQAANKILCENFDYNNIKVDHRIYLESSNAEYHSYTNDYSINFNQKNTVQTLNFAGSKKSLPMFLNNKSLALLKIGVPKSGIDLLNITLNSTTGEIEVKFEDNTKSFEALIDQINPKEFNITIIDTPPTPAPLHPVARISTDELGNRYLIAITQNYSSERYLYPLYNPIGSKIILVDDQPYWVGESLCTPNGNLILAYYNLGSNQVRSVEKNLKYIIQLDGSNIPIEHFCNK